jgi:hypothetical protein
MYNIPGSKTQNQLRLELTKIPIAFERVELIINTTSNANIYFKDQESCERFANYFQKLRSNIVIYKQL